MAHRSTAGLSSALLSSVPGSVPGSVALRSVAFGPAPDAPVRVRDGMSATDRWLVAVALGGRGRYAAAAAELGRLLTDPAVPAPTAAHAAVTRAAHRRQLGGHAAARRDDALGLRLARAALAERAPEPDADGCDAWAAEVDALVGLAADAVGLGVPDVAGRLLDTAARRAAGHPSWRLPVRAGWVGAELALVRGRAPDAVEPAEQALDGARAAGSARHVLKSRLVLVVARAAAGVLGPAAAVEELDSVAAGCARLGLTPLRWPCDLAAADLVGGTGEGSSVPRAEDGHDANDVTPRSAQQAPRDRRSVTTRRRHAAAATLSVLYRSSDPVGRRLMGEWMRPVPGLRVT